jgi:hypothetical protein
VQMRDDLFEPVRLTRYQSGVGPSPFNIQGRLLTCGINVEMYCGPAAILTVRKFTAPPAS